jgi:hypothetical protein
MRDRRLHLAGLAAALVCAFAAIPPAAPAASGLADAVPRLGSPAQKPFLAPQPRPTEAYARPTDDPDPNRNAYSVPEAPRSPACSRHFCVHWVVEGLDAPDLTDSDDDGVPDYVRKVIEVAEHTYQVQNVRLGWREPKSDGARGGGGIGKTDIYLSQIGGELFGYASPDRGQLGNGRRIPRRLHGYLVLDNDYSAFEFPGTDPMQDLRVTVAHEYNHILQFGYDAYQDPWFAESTATWMEDQVYNGIDDYFRYVRRWVRRLETPLTTSSIKQYGSAVWAQWLERRYDPALIRRAWAIAVHTRPGGFSLGVYARAIRAAGSDFSREFTRFAAATAEWRTGRGFRESRRFPDLPRQGELKLGAPPQTRLLNHTTFQPLRIRARSGRAVVAQVSAPLGTATGLALVGRLGTERGGTTITRVDFSPRGGELRIQLGDPGRFSRITAVVVNADGRAEGFSPRHLDWRYVTDRIPFEVSASLIR